MLLEKKKINAMITEDINSIRVAYSLKFPLDSMRENLYPSR
jgi:hypothetical protein